MRAAVVVAVLVAVWAVPTLARRRHWEEARGGEDGARGRCERRSKWVAKATERYNECVSRSTEKCLEAATANALAALGAGHEEDAKKMASDLCSADLVNCDREQRHLDAATKALEACKGGNEGKKADVASDIVRLGNDAKTRGRAAVTKAGDRVQTLGKHFRKRVHAAKEQMSQAEDALKSSMEQKLSDTEDAIRNFAAKSKSDIAALKESMKEQLANTADAVSNSEEYKSVQDYLQKAKEAAEKLEDDLKGKISDMESEIKSSSAYEKVTELSNEAKEKIQIVSDDARGKIVEFGEEVKEDVSQDADEVKAYFNSDTVQNAENKVVNATRQIRACSAKAWTAIKAHSLEIMVGTSGFLVVVIIATLVASIRRQRQAAAARQRLALDPGSRKLAMNARAVYTPSTFSKC